tara:strand:+ start:3 stop:1919 length:1917 start_codon:yes stop_codon:yes gene_type:complete
MALGTVPILTPDVDITYYNGLTNGIHYLIAKTPEEVKLLVNSIDESKWTLMSNACQEWYKKNASIEGSFKTTMEIVNKYYNKQDEISLESISTMATKNSLNDLQLLLYTISIYHPNIDVYIICDSTVYSYLTKQTYNNLNINIYNILDKYADLNRKQMEDIGIWTEFMLKKCDVIELALNNHKNTMFLDSDIVLFSSLNNIIQNKDIGLSPHHIKLENEKKYGKYNGGFIFVNNKEFTDWWREEAENDQRYMEQACLENAFSQFSVFEFPIQSNFGWWRLYEGKVPTKLHISKFTIHKGKIYYDNKVLQSIHTHFGESTVNFTLFFNNIIKSLLRNCIELNIKQIRLMIESIFIPNPNINMIVQYYNHDNEERQKELDFCLIQNLNNKYIETVYNLKEEKTKVPDIISKHPKYKEIKCNNWVTFKEIIAFANKYLPDKIILCSNADIFLDNKSSNWNNIPSLLKNNPSMVLCLSRYEYNNLNQLNDTTTTTTTTTTNPLLEQIGYANSQDAWIFKTPLVVNDIDFEIGMLGCDNAFADRLVKSGKVPVNMRDEYKIFHYDICRNNKDNDFLKKHTDDKERRGINNKHPEEKGQFLLPHTNFLNNSLDKLATFLKLSKIEKYKLFCEIMTKYITIKNNY